MGREVRVVIKILLVGIIIFLMVICRLLVLIGKILEKIEVNTVDRAKLILKAGVDFDEHIKKRTEQEVFKEVLSLEKGPNSFHPKASVYNPKHDNPMAEVKGMVDDF